MSEPTKKISAPSWVKKFAPEVSKFEKQSFWGFFEKWAPTLTHRKTEKSQYWVLFCSLLTPRSHQKNFGNFWDRLTKIVNMVNKRRHFSGTLYTKLSGFIQKVKPSVYNWPSIPYFVVVSIFLTIPINWIFINTRIRFEPRIKRILINFFCREKLRRIFFRNSFCNNKIGPREVLDIENQSADSLM